MSRLLPVLVLAGLTLLPAACTWVKMEPGATRVRVLDASASTSTCSALGEIGVSVKDRVGLYQRNDLKVRDELETLARNEAMKLGADSIQPLEEPAYGEQRFSAWQCHGTTAQPRATKPEPVASPMLQMEEAETYPAREP